MNALKLKAAAIYSPETRIPVVSKTGTLGCVIYSTLGEGVSVTLLPGRHVFFACSNQITNQPVLVVLVPSVQSQHTESSPMGCQLYVKEKLTLHSITNKASNSSARRRASHQISPPHSSTAFASPLFPSRRWTSILRRRVSFVERHLTMTN